MSEVNLTIYPSGVSSITLNPPDQIPLTIQNVTIETAVAGLSEQEVIDINDAKFWDKSQVDSYWMDGTSRGTDPHAWSTAALDGGTITYATTMKMNSGTTNNGRCDLRNADQDVTGGPASSWRIELWKTGGIDFNATVKMNSNNSGTGKAIVGIYRIHQVLNQCIHGFVADPTTNTWHIQIVTNNTSYVDYDTGVSTSSYHNLRVVAEQGSSSISFYIDGTLINTYTNLSTTLENEYPAATGVWVGCHVRTRGTQTVAIEMEISDAEVIYFRPSDHIHGSLADISQCQVLAVTDGQVLTYNAASDTWSGQTPSLPSHTHPLSDIEASGAASGQVPQWNGSAWTPVNFIATSSEALYKYCKNITGSTIAKGTPVYFNGVSGTVSTIAPADASVEATAAQTVGVLASAINNNAFGYVTCVGYISGLDTSSLTEAQLIYLSETTGQLTSTRPTQPAHGVVIGYCVKSSPGSSGIIYVKVDNGQELSELHDVLITSTATGDVLSLDSSGLWKNKTLANAGIAAASHNQAASTITSGTFDIARIPTGSTSTTVCIGNDSRLSNTRAPSDANYGDITVSGSGTVMRINGGIHQFPRVGPLSGRDYTAMINCPALSTTGVPTASTWYMVPFVCPQDMTVTAMKMYVNTGVGSSAVYMAIYASNETTGYPTGTPLVSSSASVATTATPSNPSSTISLAMTENTQYWFWFGLPATIATTYRAASNSAFPSLGTVMSTGVNANCFSGSWTAGTGNYPNFTSTPITTSNLTALTPFPLMAVSI